MSRLFFCILMMQVMQANANAAINTSSTSGPPSSTVLPAPAAASKAASEAAPQEAEEMPTAKSEAILNFWFGPLTGPEHFPANKASLWLAGSPEFGRQIRELFAEEIRLAAIGKLNPWRQTPRGRLALILLLDQFPRHVYRNKPQAYAFDAMAKALVLEGIQLGDDKKLYPVERAFFYLPLQHAEDINLQNQSVSLYQQLVSEAAESMKPQMEAFLRNAILNQQIINRFKRFPHRNKSLGRQSSSQEMIYLNQRDGF